MNKEGSNSYSKLLVFFLIAVILVFAFGLVADGWQEDPKNEDSGKAENSQSNENGEADENKDSETNGESKDETPPTIYYDPLTGSITTEQLAQKRPISTVVDPAAPLYGVSGAEMIFEVPTEESTRLLVFETDISKCPKLGSIAPTRDYISQIALFFSSIIIANGNDGNIGSASTDAKEAFFDLNVNIGYHYTEYSHFVYTNSDLIVAGLKNTGINSSSPTTPTLPFSFRDENAGSVHGEISASCLKIAFSENSEVELYYSEPEGKYLYSRNGSPICDSLGDTRLKFDNLFVLFSDSVTYESDEGTEMILETSGEGQGYYLNSGYATKITWRCDESGKLTYFNEQGEKLTVERGVSYTAFVKSSKTESVNIS